MLQHKQRKNAASRPAPELHQASSQISPRFADALSPIQAMLRPAKLKNQTNGYTLKNGMLSPNPRVALRADQYIVFDDEAPFVREGEAERWHPAFAPGIREEFWLNADALEMACPCDSFLQLLGMFEECWDESIKKKKGYPKRFRPFYKNILIYYIKKREGRREVKKEDQLLLAKELTLLFSKRPSDRNVLLMVRGLPTIRCEHEHLASITDFSFFPNYFLIIDGRTESEKERIEEAPLMEEQIVPYKYDIYLNVLSTHLRQVVSDLIPLIDDPNILGDLTVASLTLAPLEGLDCRPDTILLKIVSPEGFEKVKAFLQAYGGKNEHAFGEESLPLTERFGKGMSWGQEADFSNVWEMDDRTMASVRNFMDRVRRAIVKHKKNPPWWDGKASKWEEMEQKHKELSLQWASRRPMAERTDRVALQELDGLSRDLTQEGMSEIVFKWIAHFEHYEKKFGVAEHSFRMNFLGTRVDALTDLMAKRHSQRNEALRDFMEIFASYGFDFFHPHKNLPIPPFRDDDMVVIDAAAPEQLEDLGQEGGPMFVPMPKPSDLKGPSASQTPGTNRPVDFYAPPDWLPSAIRESRKPLPKLKGNQEMRTFRSSSEDERQQLEQIRDLPEHFCMREVQGEQRQILKAERKKQQQEALKALQESLEASPSGKKTEEKPGEEPK